MIAGLTNFFIAAIVISSVLSVFFSFRSRRASDPVQRGLHAAKMNLAMGALLVFIALVQWFLFEPSAIRGVIGAVFIVYGAFHIFSGFRNYGRFSRMSTKPDQ